MRRILAAALGIPLAAASLAVVAPAAAAPPASPMASSASVATTGSADEPALPRDRETGARESRCLALSRSLAGLLEAVAATPDGAPDPVDRLEAEEIGAVAEELFEEGDTDLAADLFEEAIALLERDDG